MRGGVSHDLPIRMTISGENAGERSNKRRLKHVQIPLAGAVLLKAKVTRHLYFINMEQRWVWAM